MRGRSRSRSRRHKIRFKIKLICVFIVLVIAFIQFQSTIKQTIHQVTSYHLKVTGTQMINESVKTALDENNAAYEKMVTIVYDEQKTVSTIETNSMEINRVRSNLTTSILEKLTALPVSDLKIPLGTLMGSSILSARGPMIEFKIMPGGYMNSKIISNFDAAGINQTRHRLTLEITMDLSCFIPLYSNSVTVSSEFVIGETIIVGKVPQYYTKVVSEDDQLISKINDYGNDSVKDSAK